MTVLGRLLEARSSLENPQMPISASGIATFLGGSPTDSGVSVTPENAYRMVAVYRAIALLAGLMGAMPLHAYRRGAGKREQIASRIIDNPHPDMTPFEFWEFIGQCLLSHGNGYAYKLRDGLGRVVELHPLHPRDISPQRRKAWRSDTNVTGKRFLFTDEDGSQSWYTPYEVMHIPGLSYDGVCGLSPIQVARQAIGVAIAAQSFGSSMFKRGALTQGVLETEASLNPDQADRLKAQWKAKVAGPNNWWDIPILDNKAKYRAISLPPADAQFLETQKYGVTEVARLFGLPPHLIGDVERSTSWGSGIEQQNMQMLTFTADPWLVRIEQRGGRELILDSSVYVKFNRGALLRADMATRFMAHYRAITGGWENADDIRELEDMDPLPDGLGQTFYRPGNVVPVGLAADVADPTANDGSGN